VSSSSQASDGGRFLPGQVLANRYRIIGLLGRGGMGEVYRADDLKLGQPVALKFLPEAFASDGGRLERFFNEVRTARQVTHPNVCRVHDLGEVNGHHFLSMEYVDGEDLGTLLRRIGRVPRDKAVQIARQLCAGLAAAHEEGILHRDLKPANIMLDGRGRARITDFGLAGLAETIEGGEILAGTPAYQAPEQLAGKEVTTASDIYALGLVLYELFSGRRAFDASSKAELQQMQQSATPLSLASQIDGIDDAIERTILRCIHPDPRRRPDSALAVSAALPGGDPLAAALAAGETPSPEMVADAGEEGALRPWVAVTLLAIALFGVALDFGFRTRNSTLSQIGLPEPAPELRLRARQILDQVGHEAPAADSIWGLSSDGRYYDWVERTDASSDRWSVLPTVLPRPYYLWYRQSPEWFPVAGFRLSTWEGYPPSTEPGTADVKVDSEGRLIELRIIPPIVSSSGEDATPFDWQPVLELTGIDMETLEAAQPVANPPFNCGAQSAWTGLYPAQEEVPVRIEACLTGGLPVYLEVIPPWHERAAAMAEANEESRRQARERRIVRFGIPILATIFFIILIGGFLLARRNVRLRRADRQGAARLAAFVFLLELLVNLLQAHYGPVEGTFRVLLQSLAQAVYLAAIAWVLYVAIEPFIRRVWPQTIIAYQRLLNGRLRDPLIGRDILIGAALTVTTIIGRIGFHLTADRPELVTGGDLVFLSGPKRWATEIMDIPQVLPPLILMTFVVLLRILLRRDWLAAVVPTAFMVTLLTFVSGTPIDAIWFFCIWAPVFFLGVRFGLLALTAGACFSNIGHLVRVWDPSSWFFPYVAAGLALFLLPLLYSCAISMGGRKLFSAEMLDG
jgi:serine/threonine-protein kinase